MYEYTFIFSAADEPPTDAGLLHILAGFSAGFTLLVGRGCWEGVPEPSYTLIVFHDSFLLDQGTAIAERLAVQYNQAAVYFGVRQRDDLRLIHNPIREYNRKLFGDAA